MGLWNESYPWPGRQHAWPTRTELALSLPPADLNRLLAMEDAIYRERRIEECKEKILKGDPKAHLWADDETWRQATTRAINQLAQAVEKPHG